MDAQGLDCDAYGSPGSYLVVTRDDAMLRSIKRVVNIVERVVDGVEVCFSCVANGGKGFKLSSNKDGGELLRVFRYSIVELMEQFPGACFDPYFELYGAAVSDGFLDFGIVEVGSEVDVTETVRCLNELVEYFRVAGSAEYFKRKLRRFRRAAYKRKKSLIRYVDGLFDLYSRILVVRVDLEYRLECFGPCKEYSKYIERVRAERIEFLRWLNSGSITGVIGYACKLEYGLHAGFHNHLVIFFDGSLHREDITLGRILGQKWVSIVGEGRGRYFNCNAKSYRENGIGVVSWNDDAKRLILNDRVLSYLCKVDYLLASDKYYGRTFFRGEMPKKLKSRRGRPRTLMV